MPEFKGIMKNGWHPEKSGGGIRNSVVRKLAAESYFQALSLHHKLLPANILNRVLTAVDLVRSYGPQQGQGGKQLGSRRPSAD